MNANVVYRPSLKQIGTRLRHAGRDRRKKIASYLKAVSDQGNRVRWALPKKQQRLLGLLPPVQIGSALPK